MFGYDGSRRKPYCFASPLRFAAEQPRLDSLGLQPEVRDHTHKKNSEVTTQKRAKLGPSFELRWIVSHARRDRAHSYAVIDTSQNVAAPQLGACWGIVTCG